MEAEGGAPLPAAAQKAVRYSLGAQQGQGRKVKTGQDRTGQKTRKVKWGALGVPSPPHEALELYIVIAHRYSAMQLLAKRNTSAVQVYTTEPTCAYMNMWGCRF